LDRAGKGVVAIKECIANAGFDQASCAADQPYQLNPGAESDDQRQLPALVIDAAQEVEIVVPNIH
jgi:hypothetical protein